ncbi:carbohydrate-binding protein [Muricauda sp. SCSIO 64092]|uniref:carbohydrate-binding protein n=1 Tax=Allomuricauda sp. SCSIO 64092 TaxID=2908842 RepID=UPI001FF43038|nr:carbohydrate-binding protein [Muricauda sp. SCSIO 64092]UOY06639.1 carbohydrate-binding protein [Muricauda sp. SCSIO 64092]
MKNLIYINVRRVLFLSLGITVFYSCERDLSEDVQFATFPINGDIFTDDPVGLTDQFFDSFDPATGANPEGFDRDDEVAFEGSASIRIDVPAPDDPDGGFIGGIFLDRGDGRDLTGFDALTFYARGSTTATIGEVGFGTDFGENKFAVTANNIRLSTDWRKIIIPIPDPSKLVQERGMFFFSAGTQSTNGFGFTFWIDELRFERLGTIGQSRPSILGGNDGRFPTTVGGSLTIDQLQQTFNLGSGINQTVIPAPSYFDFKSSDPNVAFVNELGEVTVINTGTTEITASIAGVLAAGRISVESSETAQIISIFSDLFADVPVDNFNGFFENQTTQGGVFDENGNDIIKYTNLNFVSINFFSEENRIDASEMTTLNLQIRVDETIDTGDFIRLELNNFLNGVESGSSFTIPSTELIANEFVDFAIPLSEFQGLTDRSGLGLLFFVTEGTISNISVDNIFFSAE